MSDSALNDGTEQRVWPRVVALLVVLLASSIAQPSVLVATPFLLLVGARGLNGITMLLATLLAMVVVLAGPRDGIWYVERAWALMVGGGFLAATLWAPRTRLVERALMAVAGTVLVFAVGVGVQAGAWASLNWLVQERIMTGIGLVVDSFVVLRDGEALSPAVLSALYQMAESQISLFPAITAISTMAALAVAWAAYSWVAGREGPSIGPVREFRFNDHLVWVFIGGLLLLLGRAGQPEARVGSNVVMFMGALYALRGVGVVAFLSGGISLLGYVMTGIGLILVPPVVVVGAMTIGIGDTWLDVRTRVRDLSER